MVKLISVTPDAEKIMAYCARVSSQHQDNPEIAGLLKYCAKQGHWSVFEMADMTLEIVTSRAIAPQILRHKSFSFQEMSQRYTNALNYVPCDARRQDEKNRQNSFDDLPTDTKEWFLNAQEGVWDYAFRRYTIAIENGVAKECARMLLPLNTETRLYMKGSVRSWIHYFQVRCDPATQKEHRDIALAGQEIFKEQFPIISEALNF